MPTHAGFKIGATARTAGTFGVLTRGHNDPEDLASLCVLGLDAVRIITEQPSCTLIVQAAGPVVFLLTNPANDVGVGPGFDAVHVA